MCKTGQSVLCTPCPLPQLVRLTAVSLRTSPCSLISARPAGAQASHRSVHPASRPGVFCFVQTSLPGRRLCTCSRQVVCQTPAPLLSAHLIRIPTALQGLRLCFKGSCSSRPPRRLVGWASGVSLMIDAGADSCPYVFRTRNYIFMSFGHSTLLCVIL